MLSNDDVEWSDHRRVLLLGKKYAGKRTIIDYLAPNASLTMIDLHIRAVEIALDTMFIISDLPVRDIPKKYFNICHAFIYVVDSTNRVKLAESKKELFSLREMINIPLIVLANKQDLPNAMSMDQIKDDLELSSIVSHKWHLELCSARTGNGLLGALKMAGKYSKIIKERKDKFEIITKEDMRRANL